MTLPKNLQEKRDELAIEFQNAIWRLEPYKDPPDEGMCFKRGFHAALYLLLPEIEKIINRNSICPSDLKAWRAFTEGGE